MRHLRNPLAALLALVVCPAAVSAYNGGSVENGGAITGKIVFKGQVPPPTKITVRVDKSTCGAEKTQQVVVVGGGGALKNAVVFLENITRGKPAKKGKIVIDQKNCRYSPHVSAALKKSKLEVRNSDPVLHNVHGMLDERKDMFNIAQPMQGQKSSKTLKKAGLIKLNCDAGHTWMNAYIYVFEHPYFAVTGSDGSFKLDQVPPGKYKLVAWHEKLGKKETWVTVSAGGAAKVDVMFE